MVLCLNENENKIRIGIVFLFLMHVVQGLGGIDRKKKYYKRFRNSNKNERGLEIIIIKMKRLGIVIMEKG